MAVVVVRRAVPRRADQPPTQASRQSSNELINHHQLHDKPTNKRRRRRRRRRRRHNLNEQQHDSIHRTPPATCEHTYIHATNMPNPACPQQHTSATTTIKKNYLLHTAWPPAHPPTRPPTLPPTRPTTYNTTKYYPRAKVLHALFRPADAHFRAQIGLWQGNYNYDTHINVVGF